MFTDKLEAAIASKKPFIRDPMIYIGFGVSGVLNIIHWVVLYSKIKPGKTNILLHYSVVYGPDLINKSLYLYLIPLLALVILVLNFVVAAMFYKKEKLSSQFFAIATIAIQVIFFVGTLVLITIND